MFKPRFAIIVGYAVPADGPYDPGYHTRRIVGYANTLAWAEIVAAREYAKGFVYSDDGSIVDDCGYTEVVDLTTRRRASRPADPSMDIPF